MELRALAAAVVGLLLVEWFLRPRDKAVAARGAKFVAIIAALIVTQGSLAQAPEPVAKNEPPKLPKVIPDCEQADAGSEVVVCGRRSAKEQYRIPETLRSAPLRGGNNSWTARQAALDEAARPERPGSNSAVGVGGQSGEREQMLREWSIVCPTVDGSWWKHKCRTQ